MELLSKEAFADVSFYLRAAHLQKLSDILKDPEATDNDKFGRLHDADQPGRIGPGELPTCQDTGTAIVIGKKGENVYTGADDAEMLSKGVYETYRDRNLRYSQVVPFSMTEEKNSGTNLPGPDRPLRHSWRRIQVPVYHQGRGIGQQNVPLPADQSAAHRGEPD